MVSVLDAAKHHEDTYTRPRKRWPRFHSDKSELTPSFVASRPDFSRQISLPTIITHGLETLDESSDAASISTVPRSLSIHRHPVWPAVLASQRLSHDSQEKPLSNNVCVSTRPVAPGSNVVTHHPH